MSKTERAFYFAEDNRTLRNGDNRKIIVGEAHEVDCDPVCCEAGLHASKRIIDALKYASSSHLYLVELSGRFDHGEGQLCATRRKYLAYFDAKKLLREFARKQALINIEKIKPYCTDKKYKLIIEFLETGKKESRAAEAAVLAASAARAAARIAIKSANAARAAKAEAIELVAETEEAVAAEAAANAAWEISVSESTKAARSAARAVLRSENAAWAANAARAATRSLSEATAAMSAAKTSEVIFAAAASEAAWAAWASAQAEDEVEPAVKLAAEKMLLSMLSEATGWNLDEFVKEDGKQ